MKVIFLFVLILSFIFFACSKKEAENISQINICENFNAPGAYNNGPVVTGGNLQLFAYTNEPEVSFSWTGPGNFSSQIQNPIINNIAFNAGGDYYVRISNGNCTSNTQLTKVIVEPPCLIIENTGVFDGLQWTFYSSVTCGIGTNGKFMMHGSSAANGTLDIFFYTNNLPDKYMVFGIEPGSNTVFDSTNVQLVLHSGTDLMRGQTGFVYLSVDNGKTAISFCNIEFKSEITANTILGEARMACQ